MKAVRLCALLCHHLPNLLAVIIKFCDMRMRVSTELAYFSQLPTVLYVGTLISCLQYVRNYTKNVRGPYACKSAIPIVCSVYLLPLVSKRDCPNTQTVRPRDSSTPCMLPRRASQAKWCQNARGSLSPVLTVSRTRHPPACGAAHFLRSVPSSRGVAEQENAQGCV